MVVTGCGTYHTALRPTDSGFHDIVRDGGSMKVYIEPAELEDCLWGIGEKINGCVKINTSSLLVPALKAEGIKVVNSQQNANVIIKLFHLSNGRGLDYFPTTAKFDINGNIVEVVAKPYIETLSTFSTADKRDWDAGAKTVAMVITKLLKYNKICNDCEIVAKTAYSKEDGSKILEYRDNTGF